MKKYLILFGVIGIVASAVSCGRMNDVHKEYRNETIYSGKVSNLRGYAGIEQVYLAWKNPKDYKSKSILIEYYAFEDSVEYKYFPEDEIFKDGEIKLDSVCIDGLKHDAMYTFNVYTLDIDSNKSIVVPISVTPMTRAKAEGSNGYMVSYTEGYFKNWYDDSEAGYAIMPNEGRVVFSNTKDNKGNLTANVFETFIEPASTKGNVTIKIGNLFNTWSNWAGGVEYTLKELSGRVITSGKEFNLPTDSVNIKYAGTTREQKEIKKVDYYCFMSEEDLQDATMYVVDYSVVGYPIVGATPLVDTCTVKGSENIEIFLAKEEETESTEE